MFSFIGMEFTFSSNISFLFENGKPIAASSDWDLCSQNEYPWIARKTQILFCRQEVNAEF